MYCARAAIALLTLSFAVVAATATAQTESTSAVHLQSGEQIFKSACVACHGADGKGAPNTQIGFALPDTFPDFTRCDQTTAEADVNWKDIIMHGGPTRGFSQIMPVLAQALSSGQVDKVIAYLRTFCRDPHWPRGELNVPRALITEKAYPEDEEVISTEANVTGAPGLTTHAIHEQRFGAKNEIEVDVPLNAAVQNHTWYGGVGDVTLGVKRVFFSSLKSGSIFALQGSVIAPTGSRVRDFGTGTTTFETFAAFDQLIRPNHRITGTNAFLQFQLGADLPVHPDISPQTLFWRAALGQSIAANHGYGRLWSPMLEVVGEKELETGGKTEWDLVPQMQVTISKRQHIRADLGVQLPADRRQDEIKIVFYLLWDRADGKINEGW